MLRAIQLWLQKAKQDPALPRHFLLWRQFMLCDSRVPPAVSPPLLVPIRMQVKLVPQRPKNSKNESLSPNSPACKQSQAGMVGSSMVLGIQLPVACCYAIPKAWFSYSWSQMTSYVSHSIQWEGRKGHGEGEAIPFLWAWFGCCSIISVHTSLTKS